MTIEDAKTLISTRLRGDNSSYEPTTLEIREAIKDASRYTSPAYLLADYDPQNKPSDLFRLERDNKYIKVPTIPANDSEALPIDEELCMAVVYFLCVYGSNRNENKAYYEKSARNICSVYNTNQIEQEGE